jgi:nucleoside-diphosphate-sugar epimerase
MIIANSYEIVYRWLGIQGRPLLTRHAAYILCRNQDYPIKKAQQDFGFRSKVSFEEGMERTLTWLASEEGREALSKKLK